MLPAQQLGKHNKKACATYRNIIIMHIFKKSPKAPHGLLVVDASLNADIHDHFEQTLLINSSTVLVLTSAQEKFL